MMSAERLAPRARRINDSLMRRSYIVGVGIALTLTAGLVAGGAIANPLVVTTIFFEPSHHRPVASQLFVELVMIDADSAGDEFTAKCERAVVERKHWYESQRSFFAVVTETPSSAVSVSQPVC